MKGAENSRTSIPVRFSRNRESEISTWQNWTAATPVPSFSNRQRETRESFPTCLAATPVSRERKELSSIRQGALVRE